MALRMTTSMLFTLERRTPYQKGKQNSTSDTIIGTPFFTFQTSLWKLPPNPILQYETLRDPEAISQTDLASCL